MVSFDFIVIFEYGRGCGYRCFFVRRLNRFGSIWIRFGN